jgi:hypothetical protein
LGLTDCGKEWLIAAVDPFHDTPLDVKGFPDNNESASVLQVVKVSAPIVAPAAAGMGNWDCHIHQFPWMSTSIGLGGNFSTLIGGAEATGTGSFFFGSDVTTPVPVANSTGLWGGLVYDSVASAANTFQYTDLGTSVAPFNTVLAPYLTGEFRVVAMGFEVVNTTSELNIQGLCTVYRQPCAALDSAKAALVTTGNVITSAGAVNTYKFGYADILQTAVPPANTAQALLLEGSKQWKAKEGCYVVSTYNSSENPAGANNTTPALSLSSADGSSNRWLLVNPPNNLPSSFGSFSIPATGTTFNFSLFPTGGVNFQPFNHSGALFTGLSNSTTLQINATYYIEKFPSQQDSALVVLARNSCHGDHVALDLYSEIVKEMPVGVPQRMNGMGEWFADAVSSATDFIAPVLSAIPLPMAQTVGAGMKIAGNVAKEYNKKNDAAGAVYSPSGALPKAVVKKEKKKKPAVVQAMKKKKK